VAVIDDVVAAHVERQGRSKRAQGREEEKGFLALLMSIARG
jgi:hypothetical protein